MIFMGFYCRSEGKIESESTLVVDAMSSAIQITCSNILFSIL